MLWITRCTSASGNSASGHPQHLVGDSFDCCTERYEIVVYCSKTSLPVTIKEETFDTILLCHFRVGHTGRDKTFDYRKKGFSNVKNNFSVISYLKLRIRPKSIFRAEKKNKKGDKI